MPRITNAAISGNFVQYPSALVYLPSRTFVILLISGMSCNYLQPRGSWASIASSWFHIHRNAKEPVNPELIIPDCTPGLMYIHRGTLTRHTYDDSEQFSAGHILLFGQKNKPVSYEYDAGRFDAYGVKLHPASLNTLFGVRACEITNRVINMQDVMPDTSVIRNQLRNNNLQVIRPRKTTPALLNQILDTLHRANGTEPIGRVAQTLNISYKRVERLFEQHIGLTPKMYTRILRFNHSVRIGHQSVTKLTDLAYQSGYADQNHFIKEIKYFTGKLPGEIFTHQKEVLEQNQITYLSSRNF